MRNHLISFFLIILAVSSNAQNTEETPLQISGNFQVLAQSYNEDTLIRAEVPDEKMTLNSFANIIATKGKFQAGIRYESYLPAQLGYPDNFQGSGIGYRYANYTDEGISITVGNFYEQFGNGLTLRIFEDRNLGLENAMDGVKVQLEPVKGVYLKGVYGKMRLNFNDGIINSDGFIRGLDGEVNLNEVFPKLADSKTKITVGGSFVSKYQADRQSNLVLPENVGTYAGRLNLIRGNWRFMGEYSEKINDPSADNGNIYNPGTAILSNLTYSQKGFSISGDVKYIDNFSYRADRTLQGINPFINFMPALTKQHSYLLASQFYAYATQPIGELAYMGELTYKFKKDSFLGGKYGTQLTVNFAQATGIRKDTTRADLDAGIAYASPLFSSDGDLYFSDLNVEIKKKISKKLKTKFTYFNFIYNNDINKGATFLNGIEPHGNIRSHIAVAEFNVKTKSKHNLRIVAQGLFTKEHQQDWAALVIEYSISPHWNFALVDSYNYGNKGTHTEEIGEGDQAVEFTFDEEKLHYPLAAIAYSKDAHRISLEYGKRRAGLFCVGGVCRVVPASNGLTVTLTSSF